MIPCCCQFREEAHIYRLCERSYIILLGKFGKELMKFFTFVWWLLVCVSHYGPCSTWRAGLPNQDIYFIGVAHKLIVIMMVWPYNHSIIFKDWPPFLVLVTIHDFEFQT